MSNRLTQIATRTGDKGTTGLGDNTRVHKHSVRVQAMGDVDELNSFIGLLLCEDMPADVRQLLVEVQHQLFNLGGELSIPGFELLSADAVIALDEARIKAGHIERAHALLHAESGVTGESGNEGGGRLVDPETTANPQQALQQAVMVGMGAGVGWADGTIHCYTFCNTRGVCASLKVGIVSGSAFFKRERAQHPRPGVLCG